MFDLPLTNGDLQKYLDSSGGASTAMGSGNTLLSTGLKESKLSFSPPQVDSVKRELILPHT
jgi:hypothetical protein